MPVRSRFSSFSVASSALSPRVSCLVSARRYGLTPTPSHVLQRTAANSSFLLLSPHYRSSIIINHTHSLTTSSILYNYCLYSYTQFEYSICALLIALSVTVTRMPIGGSWHKNRGGGHVPPVPTLLSPMRIPNFIEHSASPYAKYLATA